MIYLQMFVGETRSRNTGQGRDLSKLLDDFKNFIVNLIISLFISKIYLSLDKVFWRFFYNLSILSYATSCFYVWCVYVKSCNFFIILCHWNIVWFLFDPTTCGTEECKFLMDIWIMSLFNAFYNTDVLFIYIIPLCFVCFMYSGIRYSRSQVFLEQVFWKNCKIHGKMFPWCLYFKLTA